MPGGVLVDQQLPVFDPVAVGRHCYAVELDPAYVDVAVLRWQAFTGKEAGRDRDCRSFAEVQAERAAEAAA
jgi:hypothetical protein